MKKTMLLLCLILFLGLLPLFSIRVDNPKDNVIWCKGESYVITWDPVVTPDGPFTVSLMKDERVFAFLATDLPVSQRSLTWRVPKAIPDGWYLIRVSMRDGSQAAFSGRFRISDCHPSPTRPPDGRWTQLAPDPQYDVAVNDLYFDKEGRLWIKYTNLSKKNIDVVVWEEVWIGSNKIYEGNIHLSIAKDGFLAHAISYTCTSTAPAMKSIQVKGVIDARGTFPEVNEVNNILVKTLTCPR